MTIRIEIRSNQLRHVSGFSERTKKAYDFFEQKGYAFTHDAAGVQKPYPDEFNFIVDKAEAAVKPGIYTLAPSSFWIDPRGNFKVSPRFIEVAAQSKQAA